MTAEPARAAALTLEVAERVAESAAVVSLRLRAAAGELPPFLPGQHLPLRLNLPERSLATYTISSDPGDLSAYRLSVKLEPGGKGGSRHLHGLQPGDQLQAEVPRGRFVLQEDDRPVLLLTGGIGITPALSMLHALARQPDRPVVFLHACRSRDDLCFAEELAGLEARMPGLTRITVFAEGSAADLETARCQHLGLIDRALLRRLLPLDAWQAYLCGPDGFMAAMRAALASLGLPDGEIRQESFGGAPAPVPAAPAARAAGATADAPTIRFARSGTEAVWDGSQPSLLDFAEAQGLSPDFSCRAGICGSCACRRLDGETEHTEELIDSPPEGEILLCCSVPKGDVVLDL
ncbi:2Fe-2S iron-sulfur cluster-binding protein [Mangrovicoccus sp. HB161399]|uniref:2Fe-2S iron-sulfur cluster-binding protein n=1 Tax=Mangrovicoccus sp. HB161399 TaxID=2720392 RepID=UPI00155279BE|nr:2Fe-2S iron-sulfur cluster-binding protein [Mangrovicoccus sp. HB161399]